MENTRDSRIAKIRDIEAKLEQLDLDRKLLLAELTELRASRPSSQELYAIMGPRHLRKASSQMLRMPFSGTAEKTANVFGLVVK